MKSLHYSSQSRYKLNPKSEVAKTMEATGLPYEQAFWSWFFQSKMRFVIINGYAYTFEQLKEGEKPVGTHRYLLETNPFTVTRAHRILRIGRVADGIRDTAKLISKGEYKFYFHRTNLKCRMKGCYDRYHCALYKIEEEKEPWNVIPDNWKVGGEQCESFIKHI